MPQSNSEEQPIEIRGTERVFQIDRDTFVIYTGLHRSDFRPFLRVGSGRSIPAGVLGQIENVILPENDPANAGLEVAWQDATRREASDSIRYVGSKDRVNQLLAFSEQAHDPTEENGAVKTLPYRPPERQQDRRRDRCTINFFENGNAVVEVGGTRTYDHQAVQKSRLSLDREYDLISRALSKRAQKGADAESRSLIFIGDRHAIANSPPFLYWNFNGRGVLLNPTLDYHYALFEAGIDPQRSAAAISYSPFSPGFSEFLRRKNREGQESVVHTMGEDQLSLLKKIYRGTKVQGLDDGSSLPFARDVSYFLSRTGSHAIFSYRLAQDADRMVQILFPLGGRRQSQKFDFVRPPHDLELVALSDGRQIKEAGGSMLRLTMRQGLSERDYARLKMEPQVYPLVPGREYHFHVAAGARPHVERILESMQSIPEFPILEQFLLLNCGLDYTPEALWRLLGEIGNMSPDGDIVRLQAISELLRFVEQLPHFSQIYDERTTRILHRLQRRFATGRRRFEDWLALENQAVEFHLLFTGRSSFQFVSAAEPEPARFQVPPAYAVLEKSPRDYQRLLKTQERAIDRGGDPPGFRQGIELCERLLEEKLRILEERKRFQGILTELGIVRKTISENGHDSGGTGFLARLRGYWELITSGGLRTVWGALILVPLALLLIGLIVFTSAKALSHFQADSISLRGDSAAEEEASELVAPGAYQEDAPVPGEADVQASDEEVLSYANLLSRANGFARPGIQPRGNERNPDLVFPGDRLQLPDGRLVRVEPGQYIWELARRQYRRDYARLLILDRQIGATLSDESPEDARPIVDEKLNLMRRLAVTPAMRRMVDVSAGVIEERLARP